jgi:outer membrane protein assembly factor BamA
MITGRSYNPGNLLLLILALPVLLVYFSSCSVIPKNYPKDKPFVFETNITVNGNFTNEEKEILSSRLKGQLDDSMRARSVSKLFYSVMKNPPVYRKENADRSILYMRSLLNSLGYFHDSIYYKDTIELKGKDQQRAIIGFYVHPGKVVKLDSISYNLKQAELQSITQANLKESLLKKGEPFAKTAVSLELDRLVDLYRNNGYLRFNREELKGVWDTLDINLLSPSLDPFEQLQVLQRLKERRENPTANLEIILRPGFDSTKLVKYYVGNITIYPEFSPDSAGYSRKEEWVNGIRVISYRRAFRSKILPPHIYLERGDLYNQKNYFKTINRFNSLGAWRLANIEQIPRKGQDTADFIIRLTPSKKYSFNANIETSQNQNQYLGNLFSIGSNVGITNRNFAKSAIQTNSNIRYGIELGNNFVQSQQFVLSHTIYFPKAMLPRFGWIPEAHRNNIRTVFGFNAARTERRELFNLSSVNASWGYEYQYAKPGSHKLTQLSLKLPNIEYSSLDPKDSLNKLIAANPALKNVFTDGFISTIILGTSLTNTHPRKPSVLSANLELPFLAGLINSDFLDTQLYKFMKINAEYTQQFKRKNSSFVFRAFAGIGYAFNSTVNPAKKNALPFFKQYFGGGPNSMRAWRLRRLGPGSAIKDYTEYPYRFGDIQLEMNMEYRFKVTTIAGTKIESVLFTDIGNVWFMKKEAGDPEEVFKFSRLGKDIAIGMGTGLRLDFSYFIIRLDYAYKVKDPSPDILNQASQNKWFYNWKPLNGQLQLGINYPFKL